MKRLIGILLLLLSVCAVNAQTLTSYSCDFEDAAENANWVRDNGIWVSDTETRPSANGWYVGAAGSFGLNSTQGMYISSGRGADTAVNSYVNQFGDSHIQGEYVVAYRQLPLQNGTYTLIFDWVGQGTTNDALYVTWVNKTEEPTLGVYTDNGAAAPAYCLNPQSTTTSVKYRGSEVWQSVSTTFTVRGNQGGKLVLVWFAKKGTVSPVMPAGSVDNISLFQGVCLPPSNIKYNGGTTSLTWSGNADAYDVVVYNTNTHSSTSYANVQGNSLSLNALTEEGVYNFYVRTVCDAVRHSQWVYTTQFVWLKGVRCIDMFDMTPNNSGAAKCYWTDDSNYDATLHQHSGQVDNGYDNETSRHSIQFLPGQYAPMTNNKLRTIPTGEIASIRLNGFWNSAGAHASTIEYDYTVKAGQSDLLVLKYACVLENPGHDEDEQPRFKLEVLENDRPIDACAQCDFKVGYGDTRTWHKESNNVEWCDWQDITVSLRNYIGKTLKIRLTAYDCTPAGHFGYAYFTINCKGGDLQGVSCGDFSTDHFDAPEGFNYRWYKATNPRVILNDTSSRFDIGPQDTAVYLVDVIMKNKNQCYYTLEANPNPRFPEAAATYTTSARNCQQMVSFRNTSSVVIVNRITGAHSPSFDPLDNVHWDFGDGTEENNMDPVITHAYPVEGGNFTVKVIASMNDGVCVDTLLIPLSLPDMTAQDTRDSTHICGEGTDRVDEETKTNSYGCNYTAYHHTFYHPIFDTLYSERMCEGGRYLFPGDGKYYTSSIDTTLKLKSQYDCDSLIRLNLVVDPKLIVEYPSNVGVCLEENYFELPYEVTSGMMDSIKVYFSERDQELGFDSCYGFAYGEDIRIALPDNLYPNNYQLKVEFGGDRCRMDIQYVTMQAKYKPSIVMQNDGFIALQNKDYNGGYDFVQYEWFKDGILVESEAAYVPTEPYDVGSTFVIRLRRRDESYFVESCPIEYNPRTALEDVLAGGGLVNPTYVRRGENMTVAAGEGFAVYTILGTCVARYDASSQQRVIPAPVHTGMYIVVFDNREAVQIVVH